MALPKDSSLTPPIVRPIRFASLALDDAKAWDAAVVSSAAGWPFALSAWQRVILSVQDWALVDKSICISKADKIVGVFPLQYSPITGVLASSGWGGSGPLVVEGLSPRESSRIIAQLLEGAKTVGIETGATALEFAVSPVVVASLEAKWGVNPFLFHGFEDRSGVSQVIDLSKSEEELWADVSQSARQAIRRAMQAGCSVREVSWREMLDCYYATHAETYKRTGVQPHPKAYFQGIADLMSPLGYSVLWCAFDWKKQPIAFHNSLRFRHSAFYHTACSVGTALDIGANYLLFWHAMLASKAAGITWLDCGEITPSKAAEKQSGLATFKAKFGGEPHRCFRSSKSFKQQTTNPPSIPDRSLFQSIRKFLLSQKFSISLTNFIKRNNLGEEQRRSQHNHG